MNKEKSPSILSVLILTLLTALFWVGFGIYRVFTTKPTPPVDEKILLPIDPVLDSKVIDKMQEKIHLGG